MTLARNGQAAPLPAGTGVSERGARMPAADYRAALVRMGIPSDRALARVLADLGGQHPPPYRTVERWSTEGPPVWMRATLTLMERAPSAWRTSQSRDDPA